MRRTFEELKQIAVSGNYPKYLAGIERCAVYGLQGVFLQYQHRALPKDKAKQAIQQMQADYDNALREAELHRQSCRIKTALAGYSKRAADEQNALALEMLQVMDGVWDGADKAPE